ncbi:hypothetical protein SALBM135S_07161 [Streptomyces alboniger]
MDLMVHDIDIARWLAGDVVRVHARTRGVELATGTPAEVVTATAVLTHASGAVSHISGLWGLPDQRFRTTFRVAGADGLLHHDSTAVPGFRITAQGVRAADEGIPGSPMTESPFLAELRDFVASLRPGGPEPRVSARDGVEAVRIAEAAVESSRTGRVIEIEEGSAMKVAVLSFAHVHAAGYLRRLSRMPGVEILGSDPDRDLAAPGGFPGRWIGKVVAQALPKADVQRFHDYGVRIYHPNYEVWDPYLFERYCPGKERYVGRDEWHRRILDSADVFGPRNVIPNFVAGVEMAEPFGFKTVDEAIDSTVEGLQYFMSRGITPRFTTWCPEPTTPLGKANPQGAPLEYHVRLLEAYRATMEANGLSSPPGYGPAGPGNAVFSVSSFMDSLPAEAAAPEDAIAPARG